MTIKKIKTTDLEDLRIAIVHDWLTVYGGAERVLAQILQVFPGADIFTIVDFLGGEDRVFLKDSRIITSFIQSLPWAKTAYRNYLTLYAASDRAI